MTAACALLSGTMLKAQTPSLLPTPPSASRPPEPTPPATGLTHVGLPDSPGTLAQQQDVISTAHSAFQATGDSLPARARSEHDIWQTNARPNFYKHIQERRLRYLSDQRFLSEYVSLPMTSREKGFIAITDFTDPGNLAVIGISSAIYTATNAHGAYGPGLKGFGRNYGYSLSQVATGEFFGTWFIPSVAHQDPRYHRMPGAPVPKRILHALAHTVVTQHDDGSPMPNYATLLTYPISAEIANLYVPGLHTSGAATAQRVLIGLASDPSDALIGEFLPDVARRIHIRVTFFQQVINDISTERTN